MPQRTPQFSLAGLSWRFVRGAFLMVAMRPPKSKVYHLWLNGKSCLCRAYNQRQMAAWKAVTLVQGDTITARPLCEDCVQIASDDKLIEHAV